MYTFKEFLNESPRYPLKVDYKSIADKKVGDFVVCKFDKKQSNRDHKVEYGKKYKIAIVIKSHGFVKLEGMGDHNWNVNRFADPVEFAAKRYNI